MNFTSKTASFLGYVGLGAIAFLGVTMPAQAVGVRLGSDYFVTHPGTAFDLDGPGGMDPVDFQGNPLGTFQGNDVGDADTIVERKNDVPLNFGGSGTTDIEVVALSLKSVNSVNGFDIFVNLTPGRQSLGTMTINHGNSDSDPTGTFSSNFTVNFTTSFQPVGGGNPISCPLTSCDFSTELTGSGDWSHEFQGGTRVEDPPATNQAANVHTNPQADFGDFFVVGTVRHNAEGAAKHIVAPEPVPEPLTILGSGLALGFGGLFKKEYSRKRRKQKLS
jgi:hypothetical protein